MSFLEKSAGWKACPTSPCTRRLLLSWLSGPFPPATSEASPHTDEAKNRQEVRISNLGFRILAKKLDSFFQLLPYEDG
jgi:hypothetical protein